MMGFYYFKGLYLLFKQKNYWTIISYFFSLVLFVFLVDCSISIETHFERTWVYWILFLYFFVLLMIPITLLLREKDKHNVMNEEIILFHTLISNIIATFIALLIWLFGFVFFTEWNIQSVGILLIYSNILFVVMININTIFSRKK